MRQLLHTPMDNLTTLGKRGRGIVKVHYLRNMLNLSLHCFVHSDILKAY